MYIKELRVRNFRSHRDTTVQLFPITVFVGHGGSGKSNFFDALLNVSLVLRKWVGEAFSSFPSGTFSATKSWRAHPIDPIGFVMTVCPKTAGDPPYVYEFTYNQIPGAFVGQPSFQILKEVITTEGKVIFDRADLGQFQAVVGQQIQYDRSLLASLRYALFNNEQHGCAPELEDLARTVSHVGKYRLEPFLLSRPSNLPIGSEASSAGGGMWLDYRGENLAAVLYELSETDSGELTKITDSIKEVFPEFDGFRFNFVGEGRVGFSIRYTHHQEPVVASALSDGMLLFIGLMTLLHMPTRPDIIALEEPENGLDAQAIRAFYRKLVEVASGETDKLEKQILLSSHSPYVLCEAWNGPSRAYIYHVTEHGGESQVASVEAVMRTFAGTLRGDGTMSIRLAERIMSERWQPDPA